MSLEDLQAFFEAHRLSPDGWPVHCNVTVPNNRALARWPDWPEGARPQAGRAGAGKGVSRAQAARSGLGEMIEVASLCRWRDDRTVRARREELPGAVWDAAELAGFSASQIAGRDMWNRSLHGLDRIPRPGGETVEWLPARDLSGQTVWVAAEAVLLPGSDAGAGRVLADTNGGAAGATHRDAQAAALLELIERDATGRWWYGQRARPLLNRNLLSQAAVDIVEALQARGLAVRLYDITTDLAVPVVAAVGAEVRAGVRGGGGPVAVGFSAAPDYAEAGLRALCEMAQMRLLFEVGGERPGLFEWTSEVSLDVPPLCLGRSGAVQAPTPEKGGLAGALTRAGIRVAFLNRTRPEIGIPVWRAISPDLCHWKPRFGRKRLLAPDGRDLASVAPAPNPVLLRI